MAGSFDGFSIRRLYNPDLAGCLLLLLMASHPAAGVEPHGAAASQPVPEVSSVEPASAGRGSVLKLKIKGKNFAPGVRVSFSNPSVRVLDTNRSKGSELTTSIQIASDAPTGNTSLYVVNPDDTEVEAQFSVTEAPAVTQGQTQASSEPEPSTAGSTKRVSAGSSSSAKSRQFAVYSLGKVGAILKSPGDAPKGILETSGQKLTFTEDEKQVFSVRRSEIREIEPNVFLGVNTGTFHVILNSGKTYNFVSGSFRPGDGQAIVDSLQRWLR